MKRVVNRVLGIIRSIPSITVALVKITITFISVEIENFHIFNTENPTEPIEEAIREQNKPLVRCSDATFETGRTKGLVVDFMNVTLTNHGGGVATHLMVRPFLVVTITTPEGTTENVVIEDACFIDDEGGFELSVNYFELTQKGGTYDQTKSVSGGVLSPVEGPVDFFSQVEFQYVHRREDGHEHRRERAEINDVTKRLHSIGFEEVSLQVEVVYTDEAENVYGEHVLGKSPPLNGAMTIEDFVEYRSSFEPCQSSQALQRARESDRYPPNKR